MNIEGSVALVTGANRGLGAVYVQTLLDRGAAKVYAAARDVSPAPDRHVTRIRLDVTDRPSIEAAAKAAPDVTLLINNAGVDTHTPTLGDEAGLRMEMEVNSWPRPRSTPSRPASTRCWSTRGHARCGPGCPGR